MVFKGLTNQETEFWRKAVKHENVARQNYEDFTGTYSASKFYQGQAKDKFLQSLKGSPRMTRLDVDQASVMEK
jgi:hypothetical protein